MDHGELFELVQKLLKEKEEKPKPQAHLHPNPPPPLDFTESGNIPNPGMNQESFLQCSQIMLQVWLTKASYMPRVLNLICFLA